MKKFILPILILLISVSAIAQSGREKIKAYKVSFITEKLSLTEKEAQQFWPIYNAYDETTSKIKRQDIRSIRREIKDNLDTLSDEKAKEILDKLILAENKLHEENVKLANKLLKVISPKKIILLKVAEEDFKRKLLNEFKRKHKESKQR